MEGLLASGMLRGVLDLTTTEVADEVVGGVLSAGPTRLEAVAASGLPSVVSVGALDVVNFGGAESVPARFSGRTLLEHNSAVTLMRTSADECVAIAEFIGSKLARAVAPITLLLPEGGLSLLDAPGQPFHDPSADEALFVA